MKTPANISAFNFVKHRTFPPLDCGCRLEHGIYIACIQHLMEDALGIDRALKEVAAAGHEAYQLALLLKELPNRAPLIYRACDAAADDLARALRALEET